MNEWMRFGRRLGITAMVWGMCTGCAVLGYHSVRIDTGMVNEGNCLLTVEGVTNLPSGFPLVVTLGENNNVLKRVNTKVTKGQYSTVLDVSDLEGNKRFDLDVYTEASLWTPEQRDWLGERGQRMVGRQVEEQGNGFRLAQHFIVVLPMGKREAAIRRIQNGDYAYGIAALDAIVEQNSDDTQAIAWLALALVHNNQSERHLHSRAYDLLHSFDVNTLPQNLREQCQSWLDRWDDEEAVERAKQERAEAIAKYRRDAKERQKAFVPGQHMADIFIGEEARRVFSTFPLDFPLDWQQEIVSFEIPERQVIVYFDPNTRKVVEIATVSPDIHHVSGLGVGSDFERVLELFPGGSMSWEDSTGRVSGANIDEVAEVLNGYYTHPKGVVFGVKREVLGLGLNIDTVTSISVIPK
ncbi:MAG: hypothetical protein Q4F00_09480 [bacterium]|nr:hypothetical protein [bacterium]